MTYMGTDKFKGAVLRSILTSSCNVLKRLTRQALAHFLDL